MNNNLVEIIKEYLSIETNYAVLLNGNYGIGKTHFFKTTLSKEIEETPLPKNHEKKYTAVHISLFGVKTLEDVQTLLFTELYPFFKKRGIKLVSGVGKALIRGIVNVGQGGNIDDYISDVGVNSSEWLNYDELVICFDDLDRKSVTFDFNELMGFINSLVENSIAKVIIIVNEEELVKDKSYSVVFREKVVGVTIQYNPNPSLVFKQIIDSRYKSSNKIYHEFLKTNEGHILSYIEKNKNNFRNLIYFLERFKLIFSSLLNEMDIDREIRILKEDKLKAVLDFTLALSIEYKLGYLNSTNFDELVKERDIKYYINKRIADMNGVIGNEKQEDKLSYFDQFKFKYFSENKFYYFDSIFRYITGTSTFQISRLKEEIKTYFLTTDGKIAEQSQLLKELGYSESFKLSTVEYRKKISQLLKFVDSGSFSLEQYATVFVFVVKFDNVLGYNIENLKKRFKKGIKKGLSNYKHNGHLHFQISLSGEVEFKEHVSEIVDFCISMNEEAKTLNENVDVSDLLVLMKNDFDSFFEKIINPESVYRVEPFWSYLQDKDAYKSILKLNNDKIWRLSSYFSNRYRQHIYEGIYPEKEFVKSLLTLVDSNTKQRNVKNLKNASLNLLADSLRTSLANFPE